MLCSQGRAGSSPAFGTLFLSTNGRCPHGVHPHSIHISETSGRPEWLRVVVTSLLPLTTCKVRLGPLGTDVPIHRQENP